MIGGAILAQFIIGAALIAIAAAELYKVFAIMQAALHSMLASIRNPSRAKNAIVLKDWDG